MLKMPAAEILEGLTKEKGFDDYVEDTAANQSHRDSKEASLVNRGAIAILKKSSSSSTVNDCKTPSSLKPIILTQQRMAVMARQ